MHFLGEQSCVTSGGLALNGKRFCALQLGQFVNNFCWLALVTATTFQLLAAF